MEARTSGPWIDHARYIAALVGRCLRASRMIALMRVPSTTDRRLFVTVRARSIWREKTPTYPPKRLKCVS